MSDRWEWLTLADVLEKQNNGKSIQQGWSPKCHDFPAESGAWGVLKTTAIQAGSFEPIHNKKLPERLDPKPQIQVAAGDLLITCAGPRSRCGVPALVRATPPRLMMSGKMYRFRPDVRVDARFLEYWLLSPRAQKLIDTMKTGISESGLNLTHSRFVRLPVPVPPLDEQRRIVDLLEDHLSRLDAADQDLESCNRRLGALQRSALAALHEGDSRLLGDLAVEAGYGTSAKCAVDGSGTPVVRIPNLVEGRIDLTDEKRVVDISADVAKSALAEGDLLIVRTNGSVDLIGRSAVVQPGINAAFASYLIRYRLRDELVRPAWVQAMLNTPQVRAQIVTLAASSAGQHNLSLAKLNGVQLPVPGLDAQDAGLRRLNELEDERKRLVAMVSASQIRAISLRRSLLAAAFSGRLTATSDVEDLVSP